MTYLKLAGGTVHDPTNGIDGQVRDIWIRNGKIVEAPGAQENGNASVDSNKLKIKTINLTGRVVMAGAVDMHCHIAGPKVNTARKMQPEQTRAMAERSRSSDGADGHRNWLHSGSLGSVPSIFTTGYKYTGLGYTTCFDAAVSPMAARHVHFEFGQIPNVDTGFFSLVGNNHYAMKCVAEGDDVGLQSFLGWLMNRVGSFAPKIVNPGGVENWKHSHTGNATDLDQIVEGFSVTPRQIIQSITKASNAIGMPHPVHIHTNNLGIPGNWETTLETLKSVDGLKAHLTHIQFHSYGGGNAEESSLCSKVGPLAEYVNAHQNVTVDVGQVMFGRTTSMTGDAPLGHYLQNMNGEKWYSSDTELESGCGVSPIDYKNKNFIHSLQWAIGLEWYLMVDDPWQVVMSTDHPNGGSFLAYPQIVRLLMDRDFRAEALAGVSKKVLKHSSLADLDREYSLNEIAVITRAGPAKILGLPNKGHLGVGADADICVYNPDENFERMFSLPFMVIKDGRVLIEDTEIRQTVSGKTISVRPDYDRQRDTAIEKWFDQSYSLKAKHFGIGEGEISGRPREII
ncbi:MAG: formylmethanofuran dehydrogenase subunit A [Mariniblastus sp.]